MAPPPLVAPIILDPMAVAVLILDGLRRQKRRNFCRQTRAVLAAAAAWENEGGRVTRAPN